MNISDILESVKNGKLSTDEAKKQLSLYSIEEIENFAKIDLGREARKGIPEVIFAERKENSEVKKIIKKVLEKTNAIVVSRIPKKNYQDICNYCKKNNLMPDLVLCCCGGGGLIAGVSTAIKAEYPNVPVFAVEPKDYNDTFLSLRNNKITEAKISMN